MSSAAFAKIPLGELTLSEAASVVDDPGYWDETLPPILYFYKMSVADYWQLTVKQHRLLADWLASSGLVKNGDSA